MSDRDAVLCPICGWTGAINDLEVRDGGHYCPACDEEIEAVQ
ncbi:MAG: hypothetical protein ABEJ35_07235 [Halobacteriaceae archaeon]